MALTTEEAVRLQLIELQLNDVQDRINLLPTKQEVTAAVNVRQSEIDTLKITVTSLETQVELLQKLFVES